MARSRSDPSSDMSVNDSGHELRQDAGWGADEPADQGDSAAESNDAAPRGMDDLSSAATERIHRFMAESTVRGGASPADVADLYTSQEIVDDDHATAYLDRR